MVLDPGSDACAIIDPVLDYNPRAGRVSSASADRITAYVRDRGYQVAWILETHIHADHLTAGHYLRERLDAPLAAGQGVTGIQETWRRIYDLGDEVAARRLAIRSAVRGKRQVRDRQSRGRGVAYARHTPACVSYVIGDAAFVGDTLFMPDYGTARCDFPGGDARTLYRSIKRILALPPETRLFVCHDYQPGGRAVAYETTVARERAENPHVKDGISEDAFVRFARNPRRGTRCARSVVAGASGQYSRRRAAGGGGQRDRLPQDTGEPILAPHSPRVDHVPLGRLRFRAAPTCPRRAA